MTKSTKIDHGHNGRPAVIEGYCYGSYPVRWHPYKPQGAKQMGKLGRWQQMSGYGGWDNCDTPSEVYEKPLSDMAIVDQAPEKPVQWNEISNDAKCILNMINGIMGPTDLIIGGRKADNVLNDRGRAAMDELICCGFVTATPFDITGRMTYRPTLAVVKWRGKVTENFLGKHGRWSISKPNPLIDQPSGRTTKIDIEIGR